MSSPELILWRGPRVWPHVPSILLSTNLLPSTPNTHVRSPGGPVSTLLLCSEAPSTEQYVLNMLTAGGIYQLVLLMSTCDTLGNLSAACRIVLTRGHVQTLAVWALSEYTGKYMALINPWVSFLRKKSVFCEWGPREECAFTLLSSQSICPWIFGWGGHSCSYFDHTYFPPHPTSCSRKLLVLGKFVKATVALRWYVPAPSKHPVFPPG